MLLECELGYSSLLDNDTRQPSAEDRELHVLQETHQRPSDLVAMFDAQQQGLFLRYIEKREAHNRVGPPKVFYEVLLQQFQHLGLHDAPHQRLWCQDSSGQAELHCRAEGGPQIRYRGFGYRWKSSSGAKTRWVCSSHKRCPAVLYTVDDVIVYEKFLHNHDVPRMK
ncbi:hypothetical protein EVAR_17902_1 [Eumeta japonica]|uniref:FLYWCH-type domain-containing protein n=1 Tax=Eumeta variegata TaxID=151549 RepID=A0A4C1UY37_EUMVA|nr:hypothetical protein EVAR_17902_1 [Eumeta japonica]